MRSRITVGVVRAAVVAASCFAVCGPVCEPMCGPAWADDAPPFDERSGNVFFHSPDRDTARRIEELIGRFAEDSVGARSAARRELEDIGYWSVEPLIAALETEEPPIRAAAALTLSAILDPRATTPMRTAVERETSHPFVAGFAALGLARYRDAACIPQLRTALKSSKSIHTLRAAAPLTLARIGSADALALLQERMRSRVGNSHVREARLLALGFFPEAALEPGGSKPSAILRKGLRANQRGLRRAAMAGYLVATLHRGDAKDVLHELIAREKDAEVLVPAMIGLSRFEDSETTTFLAHRAARSSEEDAVRIKCADLLAGRGDPAAVDDLLAILRRTSPARLKAAAIVALAGIDDQLASDAVLGALGDKSALVRAAGAVGSVSLPQQTARDDALRRIESRLRSGEPSREARHNLAEARAVLSGEREVPKWGEVGAERIFGELFRPYEERLLREVNVVASNALDLRKIRDPQAESDILGGSDDETGDPSAEPPPPPDGSPTPKDESPVIETGSSPKAPTVGSPRISTHQELHDLKVDLRRRPLFVSDDLPQPTTTR